MRAYKCIKELYEAFLQASSVRYSGLSLPEVIPTELSHDSISRWLRSKSFRPRGVWEISQNYIDKKSPCLLIADDTVLTKTHSKKIALVNDQHSGNQHDLIARIGLINLLWYGLEANASAPIDYRIYDKNIDGKTKNSHFFDMLSLAKSTDSCQR